MSDPLDRDRGGRRRRRRDRPGRKEREREPDQSPTPNKPPIILGLAKPAVEQASGGGGGTTAAMQTTNLSQGGLVNKALEKQIVVLRSRDENRPAPTTTAANQATTTNQGETTVGPAAYHIQRHSSVGHLAFENSSQNRLAPPPEMKHCVKVVDDSFRWCDAGIEMLLDQTDFLVVGVLGPQGSGKSTILSLLAGTSPQDSYRSYVFQPQTKEVKENGAHQTNGIDMYVTPERIIFLDTQPVLSASILDQMIHQDKKYPSEYTSVENCIEMQSLQMAAFLMTVCNVILVVQDWFTDVSFLRFLKNAEMLKPATPSGHEGSSHPEDAPDYFPHVVFVQNRANRDDYGLETYKMMTQTLSSTFDMTKLKCTGTVNMVRGNVIPGLTSKTVKSDMNVFCIPQMEYYKLEPEPILTLLPEYRGFPTFILLVRSLRNQIYSLPRHLLTHTTLSEKNWFHYAARMWDTVRKSQLLSEYNRLLP
ncbi:nonsense-mediated mRNA decay factor SMG9-like [Haliotis asinina]|uniref:nonsense-mediated mRNA decay factor SMG9-like n=1 Tax=Haliotis asinina TaxID=109174 RepID=UPI0035326642